MPKKISLRTCVGCKAVKSKKELLRVVRTPSDEIKVDTTGKLNGRGVYICYNKECLAKAIKEGRLGYSLKSKLTLEKIKELELEAVKILSSGKMENG